MTNSYLKSDGSGYVSVPNNAALNIGANPCTFSLWINRTNIGPIFYKGSGGGVRYGVSYSGDDLYCEFIQDINNRWYYTIPLSNLPVNSFAHLIVVKGTSGVLFYINASNISATEVYKVGNPNCDNTEALFLLGYNGLPSFLGCIDDFRIYKKALSIDEIAAIYNSGIGTKYTAAAAEGGKAAVAWDMDEGSGSPTITATQITDEPKLVGTFHNGITWVVGGYPLNQRIYKGQDGVINYNEVVALMNSDDQVIMIPSQALPTNTIWHYVRRNVSECDLESADSPPCIVQIASNGDMIGNTPNPPAALTIEGFAGGLIKLKWRYSRIDEEVVPTGFHIYMDSGSGFDFDTPQATVAYGLGGSGEFNWTSDALNNGQLYRFIVRSYRTAAGESQNTNFVAARADSQGPAAITGLTASYQEI